MTRAEAKKIIAALVKLRESATDEQALTVPELYPAWREGLECKAGDRVQRGGRLWRCLQAHTSQTGWEPENVPALFTEITESHAGTLDDPIPYNGNMALEAGKYYSQSGTVYLCTRDTVNPVYSALADLVGLYVERA